MGKVLKVIGKVALFAGLAVGTLVTGGLLLAGAPVLTALGSAASLTIGGLGFSASTLIGVGAIASTVGGAIAKGPRLEDVGATDRGRPYVDANAQGAFVFGETAVPLALVFEQNHGTNKEFITSVFAHAWHEIDGFVSLTIEGEAVTFSGDDATGDWAGVLTWKRNLGTAAQSALSLPGTAWGASAKGAGMAHSAMIWNIAANDQLTAGVPQNIVVVIRGAKLYDPRLDSTVGGAGAHRYDDPSTWTYNNGNAALVALRYIIGEYAPGQSLAGGHRPIWGVGEAQGDVDLSSFIAAANICDEIRDGVPRYRLGGMFPTSNNHAAFFQQWEASTGGKVSRSGGKRYIWVPNDDLTPAATITAKDLIATEAIEFDHASDVREIYNTARGRYISAAEQYQGALYPEVSEAAALAEDGRQRILTVDFPWVQDVATAERLARYAVRRSRFGVTAAFALDWRGILYPPFTVLTLNFEETNGVDKLFRVMEDRITIDGVCYFALREEDPAIYDETIALGTPPATATIPDRRDRLATLTARYVDGTSIDALVEDASNKKLDPNIVGSDAGTGRQIGIGPASGVCYDGDVIVFSQPWAAPPIIKFGNGGVTHSDSLVGDQQQVFKAINVTTTQFTASLRLKTLGAAPTNYTDGPGAAIGGTPNWQIEKSAADEDDYDTYVFRVTVVAAETGPPSDPIDGFCDVGFYTRTTSGGAWTKRETVRYTMSGTYNKSISVDGLGVDAAFGVHREGFFGAGNDITAFVSVKYAKGTISEVTATPAGASPVPYSVIGNQGPV
ncbi:phage tail protein [Hyphococcus sp.]|uniref:phage tail protein n=1 Tax=Hyphococcus sp. TaxID=2038636 RepID=UPI0020886E7A|nr:MAG: hypothetical protein DHS20C04_30790 [Marinicaulis sp.]